MNKPEHINPVDWQLLTAKYNETEINEKLKEHYPIQYMIGNVNFYGYEILVDKRVFIPRPETELLVETTWNMIKEEKNLKIIDVCSGSGCIAISLSKLLNQPVTAIEKSTEAITLATKSAKLNEASVDFQNKDIFEESYLDYDVIISNPPYVFEADEEVDIETKYEPQMAFFAENEGLSFYEHILKISNPNAKLIAFEIGAYQGEKVAKIAGKYFPGNKITIKQDLTNRTRYVFIEKMN